MLLQPVRNIANRKIRHAAHAMARPALACALAAGFGATAQAQAIEAPEVEAGDILSRIQG